MKTMDKEELKNLPLEEVQHLYTEATSLAESAEEVLEDAGFYRKEFLDALEESVSEATRGELRKVSSLLDV